MKQTSLEKPQQPLASYLQLSLCILASCFLAGCTSSFGSLNKKIHRSGAKTCSPRQPPTVSFIEPNGIERILSIPPQGLLLGDMLRDHGFPQRDAHLRSGATPPNSFANDLANTSNATGIVNSSTDAYPNIAANRNREIETQAIELLARNLFTALEDSEFDIDDPLVLQRRGELLARIRQANPSVDAVSTLDPYIQQLMTTKEYQSFPVQRSQESNRFLNGAGEGGGKNYRSPLGGSIVIIRRRTGEEIQIGLDAISATPLGGILLAEGDRVRVGRISDLGFDSVSASNADLDIGEGKTRGATKRVLLSGMSQSAGQAVAIESATSVESLATTYRSPYSNVVVQTRASTAGGLVHRIIPLDAMEFDAAMVGTDRSSVGLLQLGVDEGDILEFSHVELLPIVVGSRAEHRRLQLESLRAGGKHRGTEGTEE